MALAWRSGKVRHSPGHAVHRPDATGAPSSPQPRRSLLPAKFTLKFRRLDEAGESWEVDYGAGTVRAKSRMAGLLAAFTKALGEVRRVADAGRQSQPHGLRSPADHAQDRGSTVSAPKKHTKATLRVVRSPADPARASVGPVLHAALQVADGAGRSLVLDAVDCRSVLDALGQGDAPPCVCATLGRARCMPCRFAGMEKDLAVLRAFEEGQWSIQEQLASQDSIPTEVLTGALVALNGLLRASELRREQELADDKVKARGRTTSATD
ncbi:hypothetical protein [Myxococcus sp. SDU36]|uniref:hypothetical protein n=1 Tax=Myxococcus sp. SDU36 TaxID=2831967 RepID=UPI0025432717|nr:hypothetical protein [Myxococcus sp. SDU36]WIG97071.1 hypothetical protein KGD87_06610 [Myxococcus sp. SDU36]